jgi:probable rRNA maturation factor
MGPNIISGKKFQLNISMGQRQPKGPKSLLHHLEEALPVIESFLTKEIKLFERGVESSEIDLTLCGKHRIRGLNRDYRGKDKATDVLSFPGLDALRENFDSLPFPHASLGDIVICKEIAQKQAIEFSLSYEQEVLHLLVHGFLHLLGYDHELSESEEKLMEGLEQKLIKKIYKRLK